MKAGSREESMCSPGQVLSGVSSCSELDALASSLWGPEEVPGCSLAGIRLCDPGGLCFRLLISLLCSSSPEGWGSSSADSALKSELSLGWHHSFLRRAAGSSPGVLVRKLPQCCSASCNPVALPENGLPLCHCCPSGR